MNYKTFAFFGIPKNEALNNDLLERVNLERAKVYFSNAAGNIFYLYTGILLGVGALYALSIGPWIITAWVFVLLVLSFIMWQYEKKVLASSLCNETMYKHVSIRIWIGFAISIAWGVFALIIPLESYLGFALSFIATSTFAIVVMLSFSIMPMQFFTHTIGAMMPLTGRLGYAYSQTNDFFYLFLFLVVLVWQVLVLLKARTNATTAIRAIILNEKLKDEVGRYAQAQKHIEYLAYHDHLTGAWNRRYFEGFLENLQNSGG